MDQILGQVLRNAVWERLDRLTDVANDADAPALISVASSELPRLAEGWRAILRVHEPDERGDCPTCSTRWHKCKAPCSVWQVAHDHQTLTVFRILGHRQPELVLGPEPDRARQLVPVRQTERVGVTGLLQLLGVEFFDDGPAIVSGA